MTRWLGLSLLAHILPILILALLGIKTQLPQLDQQGSEQQQQQGHEVEIIELSESTTGKAEKKDDRRFYWGIGVHVNYVLFGNGYPGTEIVSVAGGYCAEQAGIQVGDIIVKINGEYLDVNNQLDGEGPKKLVLTVLRKGSTITIITDRCKVYY